MLSLGDLRKIKDERPIKFVVSCRQFSAVFITDSNKYNYDETIL
jgi:hypothetical protein